MSLQMARKFDNSYEVCACNHVTLGEIIYSIEEKQAFSLKNIGKLTDAGTSCTYCQCYKKDSGEEKKKLYLEEILNKLMR
jgi:NAD(P)H-nitrite reductase large subunit